MLDILYLCKDTESVLGFLFAVKNEKEYQEGNIHVSLIDCYGCVEADAVSCENVTYFNMEGKSESAAFNAVYAASKGDFVTFVNQKCLYGSGALDKAVKLLSKNAVVSLTPIGVEGNVKVNIAKNKEKDNSKISLKLFPSKFHLYSLAFFYKKSVLPEKPFDERLSVDYELKLLYQVLSKKMCYRLTNETLTLLEADETEPYAFENQFYPAWYKEVMDYFLIDAVKPDSSIFSQMYIMYMIKIRYRCNEEEKDKSVLTGPEVDEFFEKTSKALKNISTQVICDLKLNGVFSFSRYMNLLFLRLKYWDADLMPEVISDNRGLTSVLNGSRLSALGDYKIEVRCISFDGKNMTMDGFYYGAFALPMDEIEIVAIINNEREYKCRRNKIYSLKKVFSVAVAKAYTFQLSMEEAEMSDVNRITFALKYKGVAYNLGVRTTRAMAKLSDLKDSYWVFGQHILTMNKSGFNVEPLTRKKHLKHELKFYRTMFKLKDKAIRKNALITRTLFWLTKPFYAKKRVWITMDKLFKGGDNGEYFYHHVMANKPKDVEIYYVVNGDSPDYARLKKQYNTVLKFNSWKHRIIALHCDMMLATHVDTLNCNGYDKDSRSFVMDLYNPKVACLAHGLTIQKIAQFQNRVFDNTELYFFASKYEVENVSKEIYDYYDKSMLRLTGHARYDGLKNNDQKIILITPTWRRGLTTGTAQKGSAYAHSDNFKKTEYFKIYNSLINDPELISTAKECGYKVVYLLHPAMSSQLVDFDKHEDVDIVAATSDISYEKILTESSLMVTDYSGVQFDFAYMKKPVVYYHPDTLPPQYESGGLVYETMGFGPICKNHKEIIDSLCYYMKRQCQMEDMYKARVDDFYAYDDHNNCERILADVVEFQNRFEKVHSYHYL